MSQTVPDTMHAAAIDEFGDVDKLNVRDMPTPKLRDDQVLIRVESAGVGPWDRAEREGVFAKMTGKDPAFPFILGREGAGEVVAVGDKVNRFETGDRVYACLGKRTDGDGFYAQFAAVDAERAWRIPGTVKVIEAGAMAIDAATAFRGLRDVLELKEGESLIVFGASGGIGHMAVQFAKQMGARVLAVASGADGVKLVQDLGVDAAIDGRGDGLAEAARKFAPDGVDAALITHGGDEVQTVMKTIGKGGRAAFPHGVSPEPKEREGVQLTGYSATYEPDLMEDLNRHISEGPFQLHVDRTFPLDDVTGAHDAIEKHTVGRLAITPG